MLARYRSVSETVEVQLINCIVLFTILNSLWPQLTSKSVTSSEPRFVINVSSPEGQFSAQYKPSVHPHTNMAKIQHKNTRDYPSRNNLCIHTGRSQHGDPNDG